MKLWERIQGMLQALSVPVPSSSLTLFRMHSSHVILRRRVAWLIGLWFVEDTSAEVQTVMHQTLCHLMASNPSTDLAVRLTAAQSFAVADAWDLDLDAFMPFVQATMNEIANLLSEVQMAETQMRLNDVLGSVISKAGRNVSIKHPCSTVMLLIPTHRSRSRHTWNSSWLSCLLSGRAQSPKTSSARQSLQQ